MSMAAEDPGIDTLHLVRVTFEMETPLSTGSGDSEKTGRKDDKGRPLEATGILRDASDLPIIAGATMQGLLRRAFCARHGEPRTKDLFGYAIGDTGMAGSLLVGFAFIHDANNTAVCRLMTRTEIERDAVLKDLLPQHAGNPRSFYRDHVALNDRHVVDERKKFSRMAVPNGARFSFEMALWGKSSECDSDTVTLRGVVDAMAAPEFRVGGATRRGYGRIRVIKASHQCPALGDAETLAELRKQTPDTDLAQPWTLECGLMPGSVRVAMTLHPTGPWRVGGERRDDPLTKATHGRKMLNGGVDRGADLQSDQRDYNNADEVAIAAQEPCIVWKANKGTMVAAGATRAITDGSDVTSNRHIFTVPGSAVKGPLAHRTLFHFNRLSGHFATIGMSGDDVAALTQRGDELASLFGKAKERDTEDGRAGRVFIDDIEVTDVLAIEVLDHNSIDRFTGGVRAGILFTEEVLAGGTLALDIVIERPAGTEDQTVRRAFLCALRDLKRGRLALGARSLGFMSGSQPVFSGDDALGWKRVWEEVDGGRPTA